MQYAPRRRYAEQSEDIRLDRRLQRAQLHDQETAALQRQAQDALDRGAMPGSLPAIPDIGSAEHMSKFDRVAAARSMKNAVGAMGRPASPPDAFGAPVNAGLAAASAFAPGLGIFPGFHPPTAPAPTPPDAFGATRPSPTGMQSFQPDSHGGRWVGTTGTARVPLGNPATGLGTALPDVSLGRGMTRLGTGDLEYDPRKDAGRETALNYPGGSTGRTIAPQYRMPFSAIGTGEVVGSGKTAPLQAEGVLTHGAPSAPAASPATASPADPWAALRQSHPGIFDANHEHNSQFLQAWGKQQTAAGLSPTAHPTVEQATQLAGTLFPPPQQAAENDAAAELDTTSRARGRGPGTAHGFESAAANRGQAIGAAVAGAPAAFGGFLQKNVGDPLVHGALAARQAADDAFTGLQAGFTGKTPDQIRAAKASASVPESTMQKSLNAPIFGWRMAGQAPAQPGLPPVPADAFDPPKSKMAPQIDAFARNADADDQFNKRLNSSAYSDGK